jgi:hypothetical protein
LTNMDIAENAITLPDDACFRVDDGLAWSVSARWPPHERNRGIEEGQHHDGR